MNDWKNMKFRDFIKLNRGFDLPNDKMILGDFPVVASTNIKGYHNSYKIEPPCVVTGRSGSLGTVQYINQKCTPLNTALYVKDFKNNNPKFVYYYLQTMHLEQFNSGAGVPTLNQNHLHSYGVLIPNLPTQKRIADILSTYDDLIENNNRRIALLEKAAHELYKEWFVRFRFPGYENAKFEDGIPVSWEYIKLDKVLSVFYGKDHSKLEDGNVPVYGSGGIMRYGNRSLYEGESVLIPRKGSLNNIMWVNQPFWTVDTMFYTKALIPHVEKYIYYVLSSLDMASFNTGSALPSMTTDILYHLKIVVPSVTLLSKFDTIISNLYAQRTLLESKNKKLIKQRDLLLPRLMSGKLEV